jgi:hypothetical protein
MDRFQTVNGAQDTMHPFGASDLLKPPPELLEAAERARVGARGRPGPGVPGGVVARRGGAAAGRASVAEAASVNYGPCLYFGPRGQRCDRRATATGFCARHSAAQAARNAKFWDASAQPDVVEDGDDVDARAPKDANAESVKRRSRILFALLALAGVLWPVLNEVLRALISFLHDK